MALSKIQTTNNQVVPNLGRRNLIINGDMTIAQRGTSATTTGGYHNIDRWNYQHSTDGGFSGTQSSDVPSGTGFTKSLLWTVTSADSSFSSGQYAYIRQTVEGRNCAHLKLGTSDAKTITLSFYVKSSVTGTFSGAMCNDGFNRSYPYTYTINSANTWEKKSVTIPCDTSGTWRTDHQRGFFISWALGSGSLYGSGTAGQWNASGQIAAAGTTNLMATNGATWYMTGCQLEVGDTATEFEHRSYGEELAACQRYYQKIGAVARVSFGAAVAHTTGAVFCPVRFMTTMRTTPSQSHSGSENFYITGSNQNQSVPSGQTFGTEGININGVTLSVPGTVTVGNGYWFNCKADAVGYIAWDAEL